MFPSKLNGPDAATVVGLMTAAGVYLIYNNALPTTADIRGAAAHDDEIEHERKKAAWLSAALVGGVFIVSRDLNSYILSGIALFGIDYMHKHANGINPATKQLDTGGDQSISGVPDIPLPDYASDDQPDTF